MGLKEKRALKAFQDDVFPGLKKAIEEAGGCEFEIEVQWDGLVEDGYDHLFNDAWDKMYFKPVVAAFQNIAVDDMGKEALKDGVKKILFCNTSGNSTESTVSSFEDGVLKIDASPFSNIDFWEQRAKALQEKVESGL